MRMPGAGQPPAYSLTDILFILLATCSFCLGGFGFFVLVKTKPAAQPPRPYIASEQELDAERLLQRRKLLALLLAEPELPSANVPAPEAPPAKTPSEPPADRKEPKPAKKNSAPLKTAEPEAPPGPAPPVRVAAATTRPLGSPEPTKDALVTYLSGELAGIQVELRAIASRLAVLEFSAKQLQEAKGLYDWFMLLASLIGAIQTIWIIVTAVEKRQTRKEAPSE